MERNVINELTEIIEYLTIERERRIHQLGTSPDSDGGQCLRMLEDIDNMDHAVQLLRSSVVLLEVSGFTQ